MAAIDVGSEAIGRDDDCSATNTLIALDNPANLDGEITSIEIWAKNALTGLKVGMFYLVSETTYKCRSAVAIGDVAAGSKVTKTFSGISVVTNDLIGMYFTTGDMERSGSGEAGGLYISGDKVTVDDETEYTAWDGVTFSIKGIGAELAGAHQRGYIVG